MATSTHIEWNYPIYCNFFSLINGGNLTFGVHFDKINAEKHPKGDAAMDNQYLQIQTFLEQMAEITVRLNLIPYDGSIEIKDRHG